jgi:hypothetical protein
VGLLLVWGDPEGDSMIRCFDDDWAGGTDGDANRPWVVDLDLDLDIQRHLQ